MLCVDSSDIDLRVIVEDSHGCQAASAATDLPDSLQDCTKLLSHSDQGRVSHFGNPESFTNHLLFSVTKRLEHLIRFISLIDIDHLIKGGFIYLF